MVTTPFRRVHEGWVWWHVDVIPAIREVEARGLPYEAHPGKVSSRPYLQNKLKAKGLRVWFKW
jgi:hypothetical protein